MTYTLDANGNRTSVNQNGVIDYYGVTADNRLHWVNRGVNAQPTPGQNEPYTKFSFTANGAVSYRDRRYTQGGLRQELDFFWDGDERLRKVTERPSGSLFFEASYNGDGIRVKKTDQRGALGLQVHDYSYGPGGLL